LHSQAIKGITRDKLALSIEASSAAFDAEAARQALIDNGAESVEIVPVPRVGSPAQLGRASTHHRGHVSRPAWSRGAGLFAAEKLIPIVPPMIHMHNQPKLNAFHESAFFVDGRGNAARGCGNSSTRSFAAGLCHPERSRNFAEQSAAAHPVHCRARAQSL